ncbi:threonine dehydratase [Sphingomonas colocasiae]|uniref:Threonine dehydratase n=1 Tax=Sphingomonas colocasiae TaxID=1848973 RepID=A0ABS7PTZ5_9SPHN|nr:threonine dehydratase [Sphingomonas colocasiae]
MIGLDDIRDASAIVYADMPATPQYRWPILEAICGCELWVKHENHSPIGCFKLRGGLAYMDWFVRNSADGIGVIAPTRGNHGQSVARAAGKYGRSSTIIVPEGNSPDKNVAMAAWGARVVVKGQDYQQAREHAISLEQSTGVHMIRSFTPQLLRGIATYPLEMFSAISDVDVVYVPIGMGSGISATLLVRDLLGLTTEVIGVVADGAPAYALSFEQGGRVSTDTAETVADGLACRTPDEGVVDLLVRRAERVVRVTDDEILDACALYLAATHNLVEGAGAAALAAVFKDRDRLRGKRVAIVLSGGNLDSGLFSPVIARVERWVKRAQQVFA